MPDEHSLFSASGSDGWIYCHGKILMETGRRTSSTYADEGTAAHELADMVLKRRLSGDNVSAHAYLGRKIEVKRDGGKRVFTVDSDMADHVDSYVNGFLISSNGKRVLRYAERRVHYNEALGVKAALAWGTGDAFAIIMDAPRIEWPEDSGQFFEAGVEAQIHDLKFGRGVRVEADGGQMKHYGLGLLQDFDLVADITRVRMVIHQPRLDHYDELVMSADDLRAWAAPAKAAAQRIMTLMDNPELQPPKGGWQNAEDVPSALVAHLKPTEKGCRFCDAKTICPALIADVTEAVTGASCSDKGDFKPISVESPEAVKDWGDNWLTMFATRLDQIDVLTKAARAEIDRRVLLHGRDVPGFKIVMGRQGNREYSDKGEAEAILKKLGVGSQVYKQTLLTPTQLEKQSPDAYAAVAHLITRAPGKPAVVHESDTRPPFEGHVSQASDFQPVSAHSGGHPFR